MSRTLWPLAALAMLAVIVAGCGNGSAGTGSGDNSTAAAPADTGSNSTAASHTSTATAREKAVKFAECMRANGVSDFPDPKAKGEFDYGVSVTREVWTKAVNACKDLQPPGTLSAKRTPKEQAATLKFAQCVRDNGVKDFPDPANGEPLVDTYKIPSSNRPGGMTILNAAMHKCGSILRRAAGGQG